MNTFVRWAVLFRSDNKLDGYRESLCGNYRSDDLIPMLFRTRREARAWRDQHYGYIRDRRDVQQEPHGWKPAKVVKVAITIVLSPETKKISPGFTC